LLNLAAAWHLSRGDFEPARRYVDSALKQQPEDVQSLLVLARLQAAQKDLTGAKATLERLLKLKPDNGMALLGLSQIATQQGNAAEASRWLEEWRKRDPHSADARLLLARQALRDKDTKRGDALIDEALAAAPKQAEVANAAGELLLESGRFDEALRRFREAIEISPQTPKYHYNAARAQLVMSQREAARESLNKALALQPDAVPALSLLAQIDIKAGRQDAALAAAEKIKKSAQPVRGYVLESELRMVMRDFAGADRALTEAQRLEPSASAAIAQHRARREGRLPKPEQPLLDWLANHPDESRVRLTLAEWRQLQGDRKGAIREYETLQKQLPDTPLIENNLAWLYLETGDARAEALAAKAYQAKPTDWAIADTYGWVLTRNGKAAEAVKILEQAYEKSGKNPEVGYHLGVAQAKAGQAEAARATLTTALGAPGSPPWQAEARRALDGLK
jgi:putative PEP-CTERM system TPR-repeat lipoprotein